MATGTEWSCPFCQDTHADVASALPCHHQFCLRCILWWTRTNPVCPLCSRPVETVRFPGHEEDDYIEMVITVPEQAAATSSQGTLSPAEQGAEGPEPVGGLLPEVWAGLFRQQQHLLDPVQPCLRQRLEGIYWDQWWLVEDIESCILYSLCIYGPDVEMLVEVLQPLLSEHTVPLIHSISRVIVVRCHQEAQRLLRSGPARDENGPVASSSSSSSCSRRSRRSRSRRSRSSRTSSSAASKVEGKASALTTTSAGSSSCLSPVPNPSEWDQTQETLQQPVVAGPSAQGCSHSTSALGQGRNLLPKQSQCPSNKRVPKSQDSPPPSRRLP